MKKIYIRPMTLIERQVNFEDLMVLQNSGINFGPSTEDPYNPGGGWGKEREEEFEGEIAEVTWGSLW